MRPGGSWGAGGDGSEVVAPPEAPSVAVGFSDAGCVDVPEDSPTELVAYPYAPVRTPVQAAVYSVDDFAPEVAVWCGSEAV